jgi:GNAT superfamily N-acetyltransferase
VADRAGKPAALVLCALLAVVLPSRGESTDPLPRRAQLAIWCEFMPYDEVEKHLSVLGRYSCALLLHVGTGDIGPGLARLCRRAAESRVPVIAWFLLPYDEHLYVGEETVTATRELALRFARWAREEQLDADGVVFDCEPSPLLGRVLFAAVRRGRVIGLSRLLKNETDPRRFQRSVESLNALIRELHAEGFRVMGSANRVFLDFYRHGNTAAQDALNAPFTMIRWDRMSFITYRYQASQVQYVAMINRYAGLAHRFFGDRAALDVGLLGDQRALPGHAERAELFGGGRRFSSYLLGMRSVLELGEAVGVALGRRVEYVNLYSLEGAVASVAGLDFWLRAASEARPITGLARWTPLRSSKLAMMSALLNGLFRSLVGGSSKDWKAGAPDFQPLEAGPGAP